MAAERVRIKVSAQFVGLEHEGVVSDVLLEDDILGALGYRNMVAMNVILAVTKIWDLQVVENVEDCVHVDVLGLLEHRDVERGLDATRVVCYDATN